MASVTLTQVWIHLGSDLTSSVTVDAPTLTERPTSAAQTRRYAGGNYRLISVSGVQRLVDVVFEIVDRADVDTLLGWTQTLVMVRDPFGRKLWGMYPSLIVEEREMADTSLVRRVTMGLQQVTDDEAV